MRVQPTRSPRHSGTSRRGSPTSACSDEGPWRGERSSSSNEQGKLSNALYHDFALNHLSFVANLHSFLLTQRLLHRSDLTRGGGVTALR